MLHMFTFYGDAVYFSLNFLMREGCRWNKHFPKELVWRNHLWATRMDNYRIFSSRQFIALDGVGVAVWSEDEHKPHGYAVTSGWNVLPHFILAFLKYHPPQRSNPSILYVLCCFALLIGLYIAFVHSLILCLLRENSKETCPFCSLLSQNSAWYIHSRYLRNMWYMNKWSKGPSPAQVTTSTLPDCRFDNPQPNDFSQAREDELDWVIGQRKLQIQVSALFFLKDGKMLAVFYL